jgi:hypothetical protein
MRRSNNLFGGIGQIVSTHDVEARLGKHTPSFFHIGSLQAYYYG